MDIFVDDVKFHSESGYIEVLVHAVETVGTATNHGPKHTYGISSDQLQSGYAGNTNAWLQSVKTEHMKRHGLFKVAVQQLDSMKGKVIV